MSGVLQSFSVRLALSELRDGQYLTTKSRSIILCKCDQVRWKRNISTILKKADTNLSSSQLRKKYIRVKTGRKYHKPHFNSSTIYGGYLETAAEVPRCPSILSPVAQLNLHSPVTETQTFPHDVLQPQLCSYRPNKYVQEASTETSFTPLNFKIWHTKFSSNAHTWVPFCCKDRNNKWDVRIFTYKQ